VEKTRFGEKNFFTRDLLSPIKISIENFFFQKDGELSETRKKSILGGKNFSTKIFDQNIFPDFAG
jgi:hypothetical protein